MQFPAADGIADDQFRIPPDSQQGGIVLIIVIADVHNVPIQVQNVLPGSPAPMIIGPVLEITDVGSNFDVVAAFIKAFPQRICVVYRDTREAVR